MRLVDNGFPIPAPLQPEFLAQHTHGFVLGRIAQILTAFKNPDIEGNGEVVVGVTTSSIRDYVARGRAALGIELVLFGIGPESIDNLYLNARQGCFLDEGAGIRLNFHQ
ncbi:hypothetical protein D3C81_1412740 [compost metagenome]